MKLPLFQLEEFWRKYEFSVPHLLCCSDPESWKLQELLELADPESKKMWENLSFGYTETPGLPLLREEIRKLYVKITKDQVFTFAGEEESIYCSMRVLVEPGDHVIVVDPCYQSLKTLPASFGAEVSSIPLTFENHWKLDLKEMRKAFQKNTKLVILNYPHNPTGSLLPKEDFQEIVELARKQGAYIFCSEMSRFFETDETKQIPSIADTYEKGISLSAMNSFGLSGLRVGWVASQDKSFMDAVGSYKLYTSICNSAASEVLALIALRAKKAILERNRKLVQSNLKIVNAFIKRHQGVLQWVVPQGGFVGIIKLLLPISIESFSKELAEKEGVLIMPGNLVNLSGNCFRIGFGRKNLSEVLKRFEMFLTTKNPKGFIAG